MKKPTIHIPSADNKPINDGLGDAYQKALQYLYNRLPVFHRVGGAAYKPGLDNSVWLMNALNNPQNEYRCIHIGGTNGKGSVSHLLAAVLQKAGYKVGLYTSPHLVDFGERIRVNGRMIEHQFVIDFVAKQQELFSQIEPSFFEATMAMAFDYFAYCQVDIAIIEVGLGGRLDSTNISQPALSVITNISLDHIEFLGNTLEKIAFEKAGIIKQNTPVVIGETLPETRKVFVQKAEEQNAQIIFAEEQLNAIFKSYSDDKMLVEINNESFKIGLNGVYQIKNIVTVFSAIDQLRKLNFGITDVAIHEGVENVVEITGLQGRWQVLQNNPLVICDTGHNTSGIQFVTDQLKLQTCEKMHIVIGMVNDKDVSAVLALLPTNAEYYFTQANIARALPAEILLQKAAGFGLNGNAYSSVNLAIKSVLNNSNINDMVFIGGSNFIVGEALPYFKEKNKS